MKLKHLLVLLMSVAASGVPAQNTGNYSIDIPSGAHLLLGMKPGNKHFVDFTNVEPVAKEEKGSIITYSYNLASSQVYNYRVWKEGCLTYAGYFTMNSDESKCPLISFSDDDLNAHSPKEVIHDPKSNNGYETGDIFMNINPQGHLELTVGQTFDAHAMRTWELTNNVVNNYFFEPDFHYAVYDVNGNPSDDIIKIEQSDGSAWATVTALNAGTAIVVVTYDAICVNYYNGTAKADFAGGSFWGAIWPENSAIFVVTVDQPTTDIEPNMVVNEEYNADTQKLAGRYVDAEHDVFYFLDTEEGYYYTFSPTNVTNVEIAYPSIGSNSVIYSGFGVDGVVDNGDGSYTVLLNEGRQIVKLSDTNGNSRYQILTAKRCHREITNLSRPTSSRFQPGDKIGVQYSGLYHPANKIAGVYNMSAFITYNGIPNGSTTVGTPSQYQFASNESAQAATFVIPDDISTELMPVYVIDKGVIQVNGNGDPIGNHRNISKTEGRLPNLNAVSHKTYFGALSPIEIPLQPMRMFNITLNLNVDEVDIKLVWNGNKEILPNEDGSYSWTYGDYALTATKPGYRCLRQTFSLGENDALNQAVEVVMVEGPDGMWDGTTISEVKPDEDNVYHINNGAQLAYISRIVNESKNSTLRIVLDSDIDLGNYDWMPIAKEKSHNFAGRFDGNNHKINGLYINDKSLSYAGLFGYVKGLSTSQAIIENVIVNGEIYAANNVGGVVGYVDNYSTVTHCANYGNVSGDTYVGGVLGYLSATKTSLSNCYNVGAVLGVANVGGVVGYNKAAAVMQNMFSIGVVEGTSAGACVGGTTAKTNLSGAYSIYECQITDNQTLVTAEQMASGEIAYKLGDAFFQTIGEDLYPAFDGLRVYCDESNNTYYNIAPSFAIEFAGSLDDVVPGDSSISMREKDVCQLRVVATPSAARLSEISWSISYPQVAVVESDGECVTLMALRHGDAIIRAEYAENPSVYDTYAIHVTGSSYIVDSPIAEEYVNEIDIFDIAGKAVKLGATPEFLKTLAPGLYIVKSGSVVKEMLIK